MKGSGVKTGGRNHIPKPRVSRSGDSKPGGTRPTSVKPEDEAKRVKGM